MGLAMFNTTYSRSVLMIILGGVCLSLLGIGDRNMDGATGAQIALYRSVGQGVFFLGIFLALRKKSIADELRSLSVKAWFAILLMALAGFFLIMAIQYTLIANAVFIISLTPLIAALLGWVFLKEGINKRTAASMVIALIGVAIIFGTNISGQGSLGMGLALIMATCYAGAIVIMRVIPQANVVLMCALSGFLTIVLMLPVVETLDVSANDLLICLALGCFQVGLGTVLVMTGAQHVPAAQVSILALLEVVLAPIWVWLFVGETPAVTTIIGGAIVLTGVVYQALGARTSTKSVSQSSSK